MKRLAAIIVMAVSLTSCHSNPFLKQWNTPYGIPPFDEIRTSDYIPAVKEGRAELAVAAIPYENKLEFDTVHVSRSPLVFAASCDGPFTKISGSPQDIVSSVPLILPKAGLARRRFDSWVKSRNVKPVVSAEAEGNEAVMALAALGVGIGLVPKIVLDYGPYKEGFVYHSAGNALGYYDIGFVQKAQVTGSESVKRVRAAVTEILHSLDTL